MAPHSPPSARKLLPQPVEETCRTSRASPGKGQAAAGSLRTLPLSSKSTSSPTLPTPISTTISSRSGQKTGSGKEGGHASNEAAARDHVGITSNNHKHTATPPVTANADNANTANDVNPIRPVKMDGSSPSPKPPRKFAPQMIETTRRSRRNTDTSPGVPTAHQADAVPGDQNQLSRRSPHASPSALPIAHVGSPIVSHTDEFHQGAESKFSSHRLAERIPRKHSFRIPDLPMINSTSETDESNGSNGRSYSTSSAGSDRTEQRGKKKKKKGASELRESQDERFAGYLLELAASAAEKQLREQAMAAYPNENIHEPVDHYAVDREIDDDDIESGVGQLSMDGTNDKPPVGWKTEKRGESAAGFDLAEMRQYQDKLESQRQDQWLAEKEPELDRRWLFKKSIVEGAPQKVIEKTGQPPKAILGWQKDNEIKAQQKAASPPMAGENLRFPKCLSPQPTRMDVHQHQDRRQNTGSGSRQHSGLWTPSGSNTRHFTVSGLWHGVNAASVQEHLTPPQPIQTGLLTPSFERGDPFSPSPAHSVSTTPQNSDPPTFQPALQQAPAISLEDRLRRETSLEAELNDAFVTQIYNYLSLGYPTLARPFDEELAKITATPIDELRKDDSNCNAKGYVGAPEGTGLDVRGCREGACMRWLALRKYVREWGRQQPEWDGHAEESGGWGERARKGSWAI